MDVGMIIFSRPRTNEGKGWEGQSIDSSLREIDQVGR